MAEQKNGRDDGCRRGLYTAFAAWGVLALIALFGNHSCTPDAVSKRLEAQARAALTAGGHTSVSVEMKGQRAVLSGVAPTDDAKRAAEKAALSAAGLGGAWAGGVTAVTNEILVGKPVSPYTWNAKRKGDSVVLSGHAPTKDARARIKARADGLFKGPAQDETNVSAGAPADGRFDDVVLAALGQIKELRRGEVRIIDQRVTIIGDGPATQADAIRAALAPTITPPYQLEVDVTDAAAGLGIPELKGIDLSNAQAADCQGAFATMMQTNVINFDSGSAVISQSSRELLVNLARLARRCDAFTIEVVGHTDDQGDRDMNMQLSRDRAQAVINTLRTEGVAPERMSARGEGPNYPRATNRTAAGRAMNRRIEFLVQ
ncbi:MAG: OmpA family protein [Caulobacterales bacterium]|jgi:outer membrane protein OmpA-like peptidoglycan-associated protein